VTIPLPPSPSLYVGKYDDGVVILFNDTSHLLAVNDGTILSFVSIVKLNSSSTRHIFSSIGDQMQVCRWLDDGSNLEYWYFTVTNDEVTDIWFMGSHYGKIHKGLGHE